MSLDLGFQLTPDRREARAREAKALLENPLLVEVFSTMEENYVTAWRNSPVEHAAQREILYTHLTALDEFRRKLKDLVGDGEIVVSEQRADAYTEEIRRTHGGTDTSPTV